MNKKHYLLIVSLLLFSISFGQEFKQKVAFTEVLNTPINDDSSLVYCAAVDLMWRQLHQYLEETPRFETTSAIIDELNESLVNNPSPSVNKESYYAAFGKESDGIQDSIAHYLDAMFGKEYSKLDLMPWQYIAYAYMYKNLKYQTPFYEEYAKEKFKNKYIVNYFGNAKTSGEHHRGMLLHDYKNDGNFILEMLCKDTMDQLFFAQVPRGKSLKESYENIMNRYAKKEVEYLHGTDVVKIPYVEIDTTLDLEEISNLTFTNQALKGTVVSTAKESIKLELNKKGVVIEAGAYTIIHFADEDEIKTDRELHIDSSFFIIMKRKDKDLPYFMYYVNGPEFMRHLHIPSRKISKNEKELCGRWKYVSTEYTNKNGDSIEMVLTEMKQDLCFYNNGRIELQRREFVNRRGRFMMKASNKLIFKWYDHYDKHKYEEYNIVLFKPNKSLIIEKNGIILKLEHVHSHEGFNYIPSHPK